MSLQAKIEAVIYASEEPVTLPQLMGLLGEEAQAELDALDSQQTSLALGLGDDDRLADSEAPAGEASGDEDALNAELLDNPALDDAEEPQVAPAEQPEAAPQPAEAASVYDGELQPEPAGETTPAEASEPALAEASAPSADDKKQAREKERRLRDYFRSLLDRLIAEYANSDRGLEIREVAGGFRLATKPEYHDAVRGFVKSLKPPMKLSLQALETLAVIAYKQPVTAPEISEIRGVESGGVLGTLMARKLIGTAGRKAVIGRPMLYKTTKEFLLRFGLKDINELPSIEEFEKMAGELAEPIQEEIPMSESAEDAVGETERTSEETPSGGSAAMDELNAAPSGLDVAESSYEVLGVRDSGTAGAKTEPSAGVSQEAAAAVEQSRDVHESQADGVPDEDSSASPHTDTDNIDNHEPYTGNDVTGA